jgi:hypothetical protein
VLAWQREIASRWQDLRFGRVAIESRDGDHRYEVELHLGSLRPEDVQTPRAGHSGVLA